MQTDAGPWLAPAAALARFTAPAGQLAPVQALRSREFARYGFRVGGIGLLIAEGTDSELIEARAVAPIPHSPPWLAGMMNRRGHPIPVFDLRIALELPAPADASDTGLVLVLGKGDNALAVRTDTRPQPLRGMTATAAASMLPERLAPYSSASWLHDGQLWVEFDHRGYFSSLAGAPVDD